MNEVTISGENVQGIMGWIAIAIALSSLIWTFHSNRRTERRSYRDNYWFREVLAPSCLNPVLALRETWRVKIHSLFGVSIDGALLRTFVSDLQSETAALIASMWVARIFDGTFYQSAATALGKIEDAVTNIMFEYLKRGLPCDQSGVDKMVDALTEQCLMVLQFAATLHASNMKIKAAPQAKHRDFKNFFRRFIS